MSEIRKALKFQIQFSKSEEILKWFKEIYFRFDPHHYLGRKITDYLLVPLTREQHQERHNNPDKYELEDLIKSLGILIQYTEHLELIIKEQKMARESKHEYAIKNQISILLDRKEKLEESLMESQAEMEKIDYAITELQNLLIPLKEEKEVIQ